MGDEKAVSEQTLLCQICEKSDDGIVQCSGPCHGMYHTVCSGHSSHDGAYLCEECYTGKSRSIIFTSQAYHIFVEIENSSFCCWTFDNSFEQYICFSDIILCFSVNFMQCTVACLDVIGIHTCFECKKTSDGMVQCSVPMCGRYYHAECLRRLGVTGRKDSSRIICSRHCCATCSTRFPAKSSPGTPLGSVYDVQ